MLSLGKRFSFKWQPPSFFYSGPRYCRFLMRSVTFSVPATWKSGSSTLSVLLLIYKLSTDPDIKSRGVV